VPKIQRFLFAFVSTALLLESVSAFAQSAAERSGLEQSGRDEAVVTMAGKGRPRIPLAFPALKQQGSLSSTLSLAVHELEATLRDDLDVTRAFDIQGPDALSVLRLSGDPIKDLEGYRSLGNEILLLAEVSQEGERIVFEGRLLDLKNGDPILGKRYQGGVDVARTIAHTFADEIVYYLLGRPGIALTSIAFTSDRSGSKEIFLMDYDGHGQRRITAHRSITMSPSWSPDGKQLAYLSYLNGPPGIFRVDLATGKKITVISDGRHNFSPAYSPDGTKVAFSRAVNGNTEIFVMNLGSGEIQQLTRSPAIDTNPAWSATSGRIAFTSSRTGNPQIFVMEADGSNVRRVSFEGPYNEGAAWSPDGTRLAYASRVDGVFQIAITDVVTLETQVVTNGNRNKEEPTFSPNGERIAFTSRGANGFQIYLMDLRGQVLKQVTTDGNNSSPSWSPYPAKNR
jgi:TolB protein